MAKERNPIDYVMNPSSVAVVGASQDPLKWGHMIFASIIAGGFKGNIYPINPKAEAIEGLKCYPSLRATPENVDLALIVVPAEAVPSVIEDCGAKGTPAAVIITAGFGETGEAGKKLQDEVVNIARKNNVGFVGPNCMGVCSSPAKLSALMVPFLHPKGEVAFVSQSGGYGMQLYLMASNVGVGISKFISSGNEACFKGVDYLEYFGNDDSVKVIAMYIESVREGRRFLKVANEVSQKKPIVVIKVGVSEAGSKAAMSHTGALAGSDKVYDAAFKQAGIIRAADAEEMFDVIKAFARCPLPKGNRIGITSNSGGICVETSDAADAAGLKIPTFSEERQKEILKYIPWFGNPRNPVDLTATLNMASFLKVPEVIVQDENIDGLIMLGLGTSVIQQLFPTAPKETFVELFKNLNKQIIDSTKKYGKPVIVINPSADMEADAARFLEENNVPVYMTPERAVKAMAALYRYKQNRDRLKAQQKF